MILRSASIRIVRVTRSLSCLIALAMIFGLIGTAKVSRPAAAKQADKVESPQATQTVFTNSAAITIPDSGNASPYPSTIAVSGLSGNVDAAAGSVKVTLNNFSHTFPDDLGVVLVGPTGAALLMMDGVSETPASGITFTLSDTGAAQAPDVDALTTNTTYKPAAYFTGDSFPAPGPLLAYNHPGPAGGNTATFSSTFGGTTPNGNWNLFIVDFVAGDSGSVAGGWTLDITTAGGPSNCTTAKRPLDYDGDGKTDYVVARPAGGVGTQLTWYVRDAATGAGGTAVNWGLNGDGYVPADYDGDGKADVAIWRAGQTYVLRSSTNSLQQIAIGAAGDNPSVVGDYDGDGKADAAVFRSGANAGNPSFWIYQPSLGGSPVIVQWGTNGDFPAPGDYDGDGKNDFVVQRNNGGGQARFFEHFTGGGADSSVVFGTPTDVISPGLWDSDCKTDIAVLRGSAGQIAWFYLSSVNGSTGSALWGASATDFPTQGDYDGDGKTDFAVWRPNADPTMNAFFINKSSDGGTIVQAWGLNQDYPVANFNNH